MKLKIGSKNFDVILQPHACKDHGTDSSGRMSDWYQKIWIDMDNRSKNAREHDLWHEVMEAIDKVFDLRLSHQTITTIALATHQVIQQKDFFNKFMEKIEDENHC